MPNIRAVERPSPEAPIAKGLKSQTAWKPDHGESTNDTECMSVPYQRALQRRIVAMKDSVCDNMI
jgi:hypothetical protein